MTAQSDFLGIFDWHKVKDPKGKTRIEYGAFDRVEEYWDPRDVQDYFDEMGVEHAILYMNREYLIRHDKYAIELIKDGDFKILRCVRD